MIALLFDVNKMAFNSILNSQLTEKIGLTAGIQLFREKNHNFKIVDDLMGGDFYLDFDDFALRDFPGNLMIFLSQPNGTMFLFIEKVI